MVVHLMVRLEFVVHGDLFELIRSKLAYQGLAPDTHIAQKWRAWRDCPEGSWGRGVADFYEAHHFPFPGERHGICTVDVMAGIDHFALADRQLADLRAEFCIPPKAVTG